ncbi:MAG: hypothetical protein IJB25_01320 [Clostridia bacterium]|nr:hypothetical protein [Clostridia bacterium]MBQ9855333.1 hypothetical protein [Clostridia bacterium]
MSLCECSLCGKQIHTRAMKACEVCFSPLCADCVKTSGAYCQECRRSSYD